MNLAQSSNLALLLRKTARLFPNRTAVIHGEQRTTWKEIDQRVDAMVNALKHLGVKKGDRILVQSPNCLEMFETCWVAFRIGCVWVPTNFRLTPPEVAYLAQSSGASVMIADSQFTEHIAAARRESPQLRHVIVIGEAKDSQLSYSDLVQKHAGLPASDEVVSYDDPLWFFYTSGTTGRPKAGILTHGQMNFVVNNHLTDLIPGTDENDCSIAVAPLSHGAGIHALLNVAKGAPTVLLPSDKLEPRVFWELVQTYQVTNLFTVPTIVKMLVEDPSIDEFDHSSLRYVIYAGAPMYRADQKLALQKLGKVLVQYFGLGEVTGCITVLPARMHSDDDSDANANVGSCGFPRTGMEVAILDSEARPVPVGEIGEICCRGPAVFSGYHGNEEATQKALRGGWFHTGDIGKVDHRGLLYITGRESDMYISGGSNVYPREVEEVLLTHPNVAEVAVLGVPDVKWGEIGVAVIVCKDGNHEQMPEALLKHLDGQCAKYRWPRHFFFWKSLPKSGYGKVNKKDIRELLVTNGDIQINEVA